MYVYVLNKENKPLMPTKPVVARLLLKSNKAKVVKKIPFTIKLIVETTQYIQEIIGGMDTGSKFIGCAVAANNNIVYQSEVSIRQDISKRMKRRAMYRKNRRYRKTRYRESRWINRASKSNIAPSIKSKIDSHLREKEFVESILPITIWVVETASFDISKLSDLKILKEHGYTYQDGNQKGFYNVKAYVLHRDGYRCKKCKVKNKKMHVHHIVFRSHGGTDAPNNLITLCETCHNKLHRNEFKINGAKSKTRHATQIGVVKSQLKKQFGKFIETFGYETKWMREQILGLPKTHCNDAISICCVNNDIRNIDDTIYYKRHVPAGDYRQTRGKRSDGQIPTGKIFGLRKFDLIKTSKGVGFVKGKCRKGRFTICDIFWDNIGRVQVKNNHKRILARTTTLIERGMAHSCVKLNTTILCA